MSSFEQEMKKLAIDWANCVSSHSDDVVGDIYGIILQFFPDWNPDDEEAKERIRYYKEWREKLKKYESPSSIG